jgi:hypothetical protein
VQLFTRPGPENTEQVLHLVRDRGASLGISTCLVATTRGRTAQKAAGILEGFRIVAVTHVTGFKDPNAQELREGDRRRLEEAGVQVLTAGHALAGVDRAVRSQLGGYQLSEVVAQTLRVFGQGTKVAVEIALMAADAGLVKSGVPVISVGGTGEGADTALVVLPANTHRFFDLKVQEIICKPGSW